MTGRFLRTAGTDTAGDWCVAASSRSPGVGAMDGEADSWQKEQGECLQIEQVSYPDGRNSSAELG